MARQRRTQVALAAALGLTQPAVSRRLRGDVAFGVDELVITARFLELPLSALLAEAAA